MGRETLFLSVVTGWRLALELLDGGGKGGGVWARARDEVECKLWTAGAGDGAAGTRSRSARLWSGEEL